MVRTEIRKSDAMDGGSTGYVGWAGLVRVVASGKVVRVMVRVVGCAAVVDERSFSRGEDGVDGWGDGNVASGK